MAVSGAEEQQSLLQALNLALGWNAYRYETALDRCLGEWEHNWLSACCTMIFRLALRDRIVKYNQSSFLVSACFLVDNTPSRPLQDADKASWFR